MTEALFTHYIRLIAEEGAVQILKDQETVTPSGVVRVIHVDGLAAILKAQDLGFIPLGDYPNRFKSPPIAPKFKKGPFEIMR